GGAGLEEGVAGELAEEHRRQARVFDGHAVELDAQAGAGECSAAAERGADLVDVVRFGHVRCVADERGTWQCRGRGHDAFSRELSALIRSGRKPDQWSSPATTTGTCR